MITSEPGASQRLLGAETAPSAIAPHSYRVVLPVDALDEQGDLIDWMIDFAFDTLDARRLDLRIVAETDKGA